MTIFYKCLYASSNVTIENKIKSLYRILENAQCISEMSSNLF